MKMKRNITSLNLTGKEFIFKNVLYTPNLTENLLSIRKIVEEGYTVILNTKAIKIFCDRTKQRLFERKINSGGLI